MDSKPQKGTFDSRDGGREALDKEILAALEAATVVLVRE